MPSVQLYHATKQDNDHTGTAVRTNATTPEEFLDSFSEAIHVHLTKADVHKSTLLAWITSAFEIASKLKGYKAERVNESRILWSGDVEPYHGWLAFSTESDEGAGYE